MIPVLVVWWILSIVQEGEHVILGRRVHRREADSKGRRRHSPMSGLKSIREAFQRMKENRRKRKETRRDAKREEKKLFGIFRMLTNKKRIPAQNSSNSASSSGRNGVGSRTTQGNTSSHSTSTAIVTT